VPVLTRWMIKTSLVYLALALLVGVWQAAGVVFPGLWTPPGLRVVAFHLLAVGWLTLLIFGVALWMFPKFSLARPRGPEWLGWSGFGLLNAGLLARVVAEPAAALASGSAGGWGWVLVGSAGLQWLGGLALVAAAWVRVKVK